MRAKKMKEKMC